MKYLNTKPGSIEEVAASMSKYAAESEYQQMFKKELEKAGKGIGSMTPAEKKAFFNKIDSKYTAKNEDINEAVKEGGPPTDGGPGSGAHNHDGKSKSNNKKNISSRDKLQKMKTINDLVAELPGVSDSDYKKIVSLTNKMNTGASSSEKSQYKSLAQKLLSKAPSNKKKEYNDYLSAVTEDITYEAVDNPYAVGMAAAMKAKNDQPPLKKSTITKAHDIAKSIEKDQKETHSFVTNKQNEKQKKADGEKQVVDPEPKLKESKAKMSFKEAYKKVKEAMNTVGDATADRANQTVGQDDKKKDPDIKKPKATTDAGTKATPIDTSPEIEYKN